MECQNCGFESTDRICSICGSEIVEVKEEKLKTDQNIYDNENNKDTESTETEKPKVKVKKLLMLILIIILSVAVVSASSVAVFYYVTYDNRTSFSKINQTVNCGDFSVTLKEVKTPEFALDYYPQILYDLVFEFHNNTGSELTIERPAVAGLTTGKGEDSGYLGCDYYFSKVSGKKDLSISKKIPAWSDTEVIVQVYYESYSDDFVFYDKWLDSLASSVVGDVEEPVDENTSTDDAPDDENNSSEDTSDDDENSENKDNDGIEIYKRKIKFKKESLQKYKENSPENFYLILSSKNFLTDEEEQYARFFVEPDKEALVIPEGENIE